MKKLFVLSLLVIMLVTACAPATPAPTEAAKPAATEATTTGATGELKAPEGCKVGINNFGQANFFARAGKAALEDELKKLGCEVVATVTADVSSRTAAIENMVSQGVDAIIIEEGDVNEVAPALKEAKAAGIIVGSMDGGTGDFVDYYVSSDNTNLGTVVAEQMVEAIGGKGNVVEIINDAGSMIRLRKDAMHEVIAGYPDIKVTDSMVYAWPDFYPDIKSKMESLLQAKSKPGDIAAVFATFDGVGVAAADAIREAGRQGDIVVVGIDGDPNAYAEMKKPDSPFIATMAQDPDTIARETVRGVIQLLNGETLPEKVKYIPGILITKDNIPAVEGEATEAAGELKAPEGCKVGINNFGQANFFARAGKAALEDELKKLGCEVVATVTADVSSRTAAIENMVSQGVDAIIIEEGDVNEVAPALKEAKAAGIIVGSMDGGTGDFIDFYVSSDNTNLGTIVAEQMVEAIGGKGNVVEIINDAGSMIRLRKDAMHEVIAGYPDIKVTDSMVYAWPDFYPDIKSKMESLLQAKSKPGDIAAVFATFDGVGVAAADAIREAGRQGDIVVVGIDGDPNAYAEMKKPDSPFIATMAQDPDTIARETVRGVIRLLNGETLPEKVKYIPGILITKDNIPETE